jgi:hypothetical protein
MQDIRRFEKHATKILDVFSDGRVTSHDLMYIAFYTVIKAYPLDPVLDRLIEYVEHVKVERQRMEESKDYAQDTLF